MLKNLHVENSKNHKRWYCPHHTARFVANFIPIAMGVSLGEIWLAAVAGRSLKTPL